MPSLTELRKEILKKKETEKSKKIKQLTDLKPPTKTPPVKKETPKPETVQSTFEGIDWIKVANSSDFKRAVYLALEGKSFRGSNEKLDKELNTKIGVFRDPNFSECVEELKAFLKPSNINLKPSQMTK